MPRPADDMFEEVDIPDELLSLLADTARLLRTQPDARTYSDYERWAHVLEGAHRRVAAGDPREPGHILSMFGTMGSLDDLPVDDEAMTALHQLHRLAIATHKSLRDRDEKEAFRMSDATTADEPSDDDTTTQPAPGPADHGGSGGMATRELDSSDDETD